MQNTNNEGSVKQYAAFLVALIMIVALLAVYMFPWFVPIFWVMPENTVLPYYGILIAIEMAPASFMVKSNALAAADSSDK